MPYFLTDEPLTTTSRRPESAYPGSSSAVSGLRFYPGSSSEVSGLKSGRVIVIAGLLDE